MTVTSEFYLAALLYDLRIIPGFSPAAWVSKNARLFSRYTDVEKVCAHLTADGGDADIRRASRLAAEADSRREEAEGTLTALRSVFSRLSLGEKNEAPEVYYQRGPLTVTDIFPVTEPRAVDGREIVAALDKELELLEKDPPKDFQALTSNLDLCLRRQLWAVPSAPGSEADVSLYDRLRVTAAVAVCLKSAPHGAEEPYLLMAADFSGIQNYIFAVARTSVKGVAKRLRARSFLVDAMIQTLAYRVCETAGVPFGNILMLSGGKFYLLLPNTADVVNAVLTIEKETGEYLYRRFAGEISVNMARLTFGDKGLRDYSATVTELSRRLRTEKNRPFRPVLTGQEGWLEDKFFFAKDLAGKHSCPSCGQALVPRGQETCDQCEAQEKIGGKLAGADCLWFSREGGEYELWPGYWLSFSGQQTLGAPVRVEQLNNWEPRTNMTRYPLAVRLMANHLPKEGGEPLTFSDLAELAAGSKRLAVLKEDVDILGYLFADGLREKDTHYGTVSRVSSLSRLLDQFFSGYIGSLLKKDFADVYSVFSGGDDLFLIGPWDRMAELALRIEEDFRRFTGGNTCVTLSAAICAADPKTNVALLAELGEEELKRVKNSAPEVLYPGKKGRNGVSFLGDIFSWEDFAAQVKNIEMLLPQVGAVNTAILRRIATYSEMYRDFLLNHDVMGLMFDPLFHYDRARNYNDQLPANFARYAENLPKNAANYKEVNRNLYFAKTVMNCVLNQTREVRENAV